MGCPYHSQDTWQYLVERDPAGFADAVLVDRQLHNRGEYLHRSALPLDQAVLGNAPAPDGTDNECEGHCFL